MTAAAAPVTTALAVVSGLLTARCIYGIPWEALAASRSILSPGDIPAAAETFAATWVLVGGFCWFALPAMGRCRWSLLQKVGATCGTLVLVRFVLQLATAALSGLASDETGL
jgi:hypothetical protein